MKRASGNRSYMLYNICVVTRLRARAPLSGPQWLLQQGVDVAVSSRRPPPGGVEHRLQARGDLSNLEETRTQEYDGDGTNRRAAGGLTPEERDRRVRKWRQRASGLGGTGVEDGPEGAAPMKKGDSSASASSSSSPPPPPAMRPTAISVAAAELEATLSRSVARDSVISGSGLMDGGSAFVRKVLGNPAIRMGIVVSAALAAASLLHDQGQLKQGVGLFCHRV